MKPATDDRAYRIGYAAGVVIGSMLAVVVVGLALAGAVELVSRLIEATVI